ncbi:MAG: spore cortex biosynthesis protein YabQ [Bacillota bacterium]
MHVPVEIQVWRVAVLVLLGIATDLVFHAYRAYRSVFVPKSFRYHLLDAVVALITLGAVGAAVFIVNWGEVRLYVPISLAAGFFAGNMLVGDLVYRRSRSAFRRTQKAMRWARVRLVEPPKRAARKAFEWTKARLSLPDEAAVDPPAEPPMDSPTDSPKEP